MANSIDKTRVVEPVETSPSDRIIDFQDENLNIPKSYAHSTIELRLEILQEHLAKFEGRIAKLENKYGNETHYAKTIMLPRMAISVISKNTINDTVVLKAVVEAIRNTKDESFNVDQIRFVTK